MTTAYYVGLDQTRTTCEIVNCLFHFLRKWRECSFEADVLYLQTYNKTYSTGAHWVFSTFWLVKTYVVRFPNLYFGTQYSWKTWLGKTRKKLWKENSCNFIWWKAYVDTWTPTWSPLGRFFPNGFTWFSSAWSFASCCSWEMSVMITATTRFNWEMKIDHL